MSRLAALLRSKWFWSLVGAIALSIVIWFVGPLIAVGASRPLGGTISLVLATLLPLLVVAVSWAISKFLARRKNASMVASITKRGWDDAAESAAEVELLKKRLEDAIAVLKKGSTVNDARYLYQLPWYILIGPPGSGKTTALKNSGLKFPLAQKYGQDSTRGAGGTRNCDWWFTDEAVLLDTAGRYTTLESNVVVDEAAWKGFLGLLKRYRPRQPVNGTIVTISVADLATMPSDQRLLHARTIRQRLQELGSELGVTIPIYVNFSKLDLISGFVEFFDDLSRDDRAQVWGMTFPMDTGSENTQPSVTEFASEFQLMVDRLNERVVDRMQHEVELARRAVIYDFPAQISSLRDLLTEFLNEIFMPNRYEGRPLLRGVYFTSGTQEGTPIDRIVSAIASSYGLDNERPEAYKGPGRSYFLNRLLRGVVFPEASLVGYDDHAERRLTWLRLSGYAAAGVFTVLCLVAWVVSFLGNRTLISDLDTKLEAYRTMAAPIAVSDVADADILRVLPLLESLRTLPAGYDARDDHVPLRLTFGLYQGDKLGSEAVIAYHNALNRVFLPRLLMRMGEQIHGNLQRPDYLEAALKVYLMLGSAGPLDKDLVTSWMDLDWKASLKGPDADTLHKQLDAHLAALLEAPLQPITLDRDTIDLARRAILATPLASRAYQAIVASAEARKEPDWTISDQAGADASRVFVRKSGKPLNDGIPGLYTYDGFHKVLLPAAADAAQSIARERWVLGDAALSGSEAQNSSALERSVVQLYLNDYIAHWDQLLGDVQIVPLLGQQQAAQVMNSLSSPASPLKAMLTSAAEETWLTRPPPADAGGVLGGVEKAAQDAAKAAQSKLAKIVGEPSGTQPVYGQPVDDHFRNLRDFTGVGGKPPAPIDDVLKSLNTLYLQMNGVGAGVPAPGGGGSPAQQLAANASRLPAPANALVAAIAHGASSLTAGGAKSSIEDAWQAKVLPFCTKALEGHYPFFHDSGHDITPDDFGRLFAPGGLIDSFFDTNLKPYVDTSTLPWTWRKVEDVNLGIGDNSLIEFQRAAAIRDAFFSGSGKTPGVKFALMPLELDASSAQVVFQLDGQELDYAHGPQRPTEIEWPGSSGLHTGRVAFQPVGSAEPGSIAVNGPWSIFHLIDRGKIVSTNDSDHLRLTFAANSHEVTYDVEANSVVNPFTMREVQEFRCPSKL